MVISKETPLHDPVKVFRLAVESLVGPGRTTGVLAEAAASLDPDTAAYAELTRWVHSVDVDERFPAALYVHERMSAGELPEAAEMLDAVVRFWAGDPLRMPDLRRALKAVGAGSRYTFSPVPARELARQRQSFAARLLRAAGHAGWVVLLDEVELIGRYSLLQRGRSCAELARWVGTDPDDSAAPLAAVVAMTDDFDAAVLVGKDDRTKVPAKLRDKQTPEWTELAGLAERGIAAIKRDMLRLEPPGTAELDRAYATLKALHGEAFDWDPPDVVGLERLGATRMRQYVRAWINAWDLVRLDPTHEAAPEVVELATSYDELDDGAGSHCCGGWGVGCVWGRREVGLGVCVGSAVGGDPGPRCEGGSAVGLIRPCRAEGWVACRRREDAGEVSRMWPAARRPGAGAGVCGVSRCRGRPGAGTVLAVDCGPLPG